MTVLNRISHFQNRRDEIPNLELARDLAAKKDRAGIREVAENLWHKDKNVQADCIKVLYEVGSIDPKLIVPHAHDFGKLLKSRNNRLVWGAMTALAEVARENPDVVFKYLDAVMKAKETGSVITVDRAVSALALTASANKSYNTTIFPFLLRHLSSCRPKDVARHAERALPAVNSGNQAEFIRILGKRAEDLGGSALARLKKVIKQADARNA